jgi:isopentenyldiphosphate isomerase
VVSTFGNSISPSILVNVHACHLDLSSDLVDHHGELLVQHRAMVALLWLLQSANMSTNQSNQL